MLIILHALLALTLFLRIPQTLAFWCVWNKLSYKYLSSDVFIVPKISNPLLEIKNPLNQVFPFLLDKIQVASERLFFNGYIYFFFLDPEYSFFHTNLILLLIALEWNAPFVWIYKHKFCSFLFIIHCSSTNRIILS